MTRKRENHEDLRGLGAKNFGYVKSLEGGGGGVCIHSFGVRLLLSLF